MKFCTKCKLEKPHEEFDKDVNKSDGFYSSCKKCRADDRKTNNDRYRKRERVYVAKNRDQILKKSKEKYHRTKVEYNAARKVKRESNLDEYNKKANEYNRINREHVNAVRRANYQKRREHFVLKSSKWSKEHPEQRREYQKKWIENNYDRYLERIHRYYNKNRHKFIKWQTDRDKRLMELDPKYRLNKRVRGYIHNSIGKTKNGRSWVSLVGYDLNALIRHLESKFKPGMTLENYGEWHIDHIIPVSVFNFTCPDDIDFKRCWSLNNLQPLWAKENARKSDKINGHFQPCLNLKVSNGKEKS